MMLLLLALVVVSLGQVSTSLFTTTSTGDGTYYGGNDAGGHCSIFPVPAFASNIMHVAMNHVDYDGSRGCGMCIELTGNGVGAGANPIRGPMIAWVNDECPECAKGSVDLGTNGDGRWSISWKAVDCPVGAEKLSYAWQGGQNQYYVKLQVRSHKVPIQSVQIANKGSTTYVAAKRTADNFWECPSCKFPLSFPLNVLITSIDGEQLTDTIASQTANNQPIGGGNGVQFRGISGSTPAPRAPVPVPQAPVPVPVPVPVPRAPVPVPQAPVPVTPTESGFTQAQIDALVSSHNTDRAKFCSPPLKWNSTLSRIAYNYASQCRYAHNTNVDSQCGGEGCGENIAAGTSTASYSQWASESKDWTCTTGAYENGCAAGAVCGHWTQIIWKDTTDVGCAQVRCSTNSPFANFADWTYLVCDYSRPGNWGKTPAVTSCSGVGCSTPQTPAPVPRAPVPVPQAPVPVPQAPVPVPRTPVPVPQAPVPVPRTPVPVPQAPVPVPRSPVPVPRSPVPAPRRPRSPTPAPRAPSPVPQAPVPVPVSQCVDTPVPGDPNTCAQQKLWGNCNADWMIGRCENTCGRCPTSCTDIPVPGDPNTCAQQASWGNCNADWMAGRCAKSCGRCQSGLRLEDETQSGDSPNTTGIIVGAVVGGVFLLLVAGLIAFLVTQKKNSAERV